MKGGATSMEAEIGDLPRMAERSEAKWAERLLSASYEELHRTGRGRRHGRGGGGTGD